MTLSVSSSRPSRRRLPGRSSRADPSGSTRRKSPWSYTETVRHLRSITLNRDGRPDEWEKITQRI